MIRRISLAVLAAAVLRCSIPAEAETFTYHGTLREAGKAADAHYDLRLSVYTAASGGIAIAGPVTLYDVAVRDGAFSSEVDFGQSFAPRPGSYLEVAVKSATDSDFSVLGKRTPLAPDGGCAGAWALDGNAENPSGSYIGTADAADVVIKANGLTKAIAFADGGVSMPGGMGGAVAPGSFAGGYGAVDDVAFERSFVWGGGTPAAPFLPSVAATAPGQFIMQAPGGAAINTSSSEWDGPLANELTIGKSTDIPGENVDLVLLNPDIASGSGRKGFDITSESLGTLGIYGLYLDGTTRYYDTLLRAQHFHGASGNYASWLFNGANNAAGILRIGDNVNNGNGAYLSAAGVWTNASSRTWKEGFANVDVESVLAKLVSMPVQSWFYKGKRDDGLHVGPVAEDFAGAFGLGNNKKYIGTVDESGIALAAIQGLNKKLEADNAALREKLDGVIARLDRLEQRAGE